MPFSFSNSQSFHPPSSLKDYDWFLSSNGSDVDALGTQIESGTKILAKQGYQLDIRCIGFPKTFKFADVRPVSNYDAALYDELEEVPGASLQQLGILENDNLEDDQRFPVIKGKGQLDEALAVTQMVALFSSTPFKKDILSKL